MLQMLSQCGVMQHVVATAEALPASIGHQESCLNTMKLCVTGAQRHRGLCSWPPQAWPTLSLPTSASVSSCSGAISPSMSWTRTMTSTLHSWHARMRQTLSRCSLRGPTCWGGTAMGGQWLWKWLWCWKAGVMRSALSW